jgi:uncharacterized glyoxalase superfamily metalloenzyme YdcJ
MSAMYRDEVPKYGHLIALTKQVNEEALSADPSLRRQMLESGEIRRLDVERHGAVRLGTPRELAMMRRLAAAMGMAPVGYYDLAAAGVPVHATAFRPTTEVELRENPFRLFTSLLRIDLIQDANLRRAAATLLESREIFSAKAVAMVERYEAEGGLTDAEAELLVAEAVKTFRWHGRVRVDRAQYDTMASAHRLVADIVCFPGPHINHLTPRTLDIDAVQAAMPQHGIVPKDTIEGPPRRRCPILLRQTSFKALTESIAFAGEDSGRHGSHAARFGEIEQRGAALTPDGRALYDRLLRDKGDFGAMPDDAAALRQQGLCWNRYLPEANQAARAREIGTDAEALLEAGCLRADPLTYEDFLPVSAAGIFQSNLDGAARSTDFANGTKAALEAALEGSIVDEMELYRSAQAQSLEASAKALGLPFIATEPASRVTA